jgi:hypothetical protein
MEAVAEGSLVLSLELRKDLLKLWVPCTYAHDNIDSSDVDKSLHPDTMQAAFNAVLSTVSYQVQEEILHEWLTDLMAEEPWEPWFKRWMETSLLEESEVRILPDLCSRRPLSNPGYEDTAACRLPRHQRPPRTIFLHLFSPGFYLAHVRTVVRLWTNAFRYHFGYGASNAHEFVQALFIHPSIQITVEMKGDPLD